GRGSNPTSRERLRSNRAFSAACRRRRRNRPNAPIRRPASRDHYRIPPQCCFMNHTAIAILAHPDDAEFLCAGTLLRLRQEHGWAIHIATMTAGDCGSAEHGPEEIARIRRGEGKAAATAIGGTYHCLEERDLRVIYAEPAIEKVALLLNEVRPQ